MLGVDDGEVDSGAAVEFGNGWGTEAQLSADRHLSGVDQFLEVIHHLVADSVIRIRPMSVPVMIKTPRAIVKGVVVSLPVD